MTELDEPFTDLAAVPVELVFWPSGRDRREVLARAAVPRLLLVAADASPPDDVGVDAPSRDAIDAAIYRLRRRLGGLGLCIRSVRGRGFALNVN